MADCYNYVCSYGLDKIDLYDLTIVIGGHSSADVSIYLGPNKVGGIQRFTFKAVAGDLLPYLDMSSRFLYLNTVKGLSERQFLPDTMTVVVKDFIRIQNDNSALSVMGLTTVFVGDEPVGMIQKISISANADTDDIDVCVEIAQVETDAIDIARNKLLSLSWVRAEMSEGIL